MLTPRLLLYHRLKHTIYLFRAATFKLLDVDQKIVDKKVQLGNRLGLASCLLNAFVGAQLSRIISLDFSFKILDHFISLFFVDVHNLNTFDNEAKSHI